MLVPRRTVKTSVQSGSMEDISKADALRLLSKWERQGRQIFVLCFSPSFGLSSKNGRLAICLDESLDLALADGTNLRLFLTDVTFSRVGPGDFPAESLHVYPQLEQGVHINFPASRASSCRLLACESPASGADV